MSDGPGRDYLEGSVVVAWARRLRRQASASWTPFWKDFLSSPWVGMWRESWKGSPLRQLGLVAVSAVCANAVALLLLRRNVGLGGAALRVLILLAGLAAMGCRGGWDSVREGSALLRWFFPRKEP